MRATIEIPDELYRRGKSKSAMEGLAVREVATTLFRGWVESTLHPELIQAPTPADGNATPAWFGGARRYAEGVNQHDMDSVRRSIDRGRKRDTGNIDGTRVSS